MMKIKKTKIAILLFLLIVIFLLTQFQLYPKKNYFYVENAAVKNENYLNSLQVSFLEYPVKAHVIDKGNLIYFGYRVFNNPWPIVIDDETYEKLTFSVDPGLVEKEIDFTLPDSRIYIVYSSGGSAWPENGCHGYPESGEIKIKKFQNAYLINWKMIIKCFNFNEASSETIRISSNGIFHKIKYEELNSYLGLPAKNAYEATYP